MNREQELYEEQQAIWHKQLEEEGLEWTEKHTEDN